MAPLAGVAQRGAGWPWAHIHVAVGVGSFEAVRVLRDESCGGVSHLGLRNLRPSNGHESQGSLMPWTRSGLTLQEVSAMSVVRWSMKRA